MNFYGRDKRDAPRGADRPHGPDDRRSSAASPRALDHRYPVAKMNNPNVYGGNDPKQMTANNTSGFNCRKVVGNPYAQSPHSYGIAIDVNTVQNPYRDVHGQVVAGERQVLHRPHAAAVGHADQELLPDQVAAQADHFFWGGRWSPGRDYQHFEYRG